MRYVLVALCVLAGGAADVSMQERVEVVGPQSIPRSGYKTWSLFLICAQDWVTAEKSGDLADLYHRFQRFGDAIGHDNLAVWFWKARKPISDQRLGENVDVPRSVDYCKALNIVPSASPYLVVTPEYPDSKRFPQDRAVFTLGNRKSADLGNLLNTLTDQLLLKGGVDRTPAPTPPPASTGTPATPTPAPATNLWIQFLENVRQTLITISCNTKMHVSAGALSADLSACSPTPGN